MKIDTNAFFNSLPIMGIGLLGIFIVTVVIIIGIYILKALTKNSGNDDDKNGEAAKDSKSEINSDDKEDKKADSKGKSKQKKQNALDLMKEKQKTDFLDEVDNNYISRDL